MENSVLGGIFEPKIDELFFGGTILASNLGAQIHEKHKKGRKKGMPKMMPKFDAENEVRIDPFWFPGWTPGGKEGKPPKAALRWCWLLLFETPDTSRCRRIFDPQENRNSAQILTFGPQSAQGPSKTALWKGVWKKNMKIKWKVNQ